MSVRVAANNVRPGQSPNQLPGFGIIFYDKDRDVIKIDGRRPLARYILVANAVEDHRSSTPGTRSDRANRSVWCLWGEISFDEVTLEKVEE